MSTSYSRHIVIIGNGITGSTVARHIRKRKSDDRITMISDESDHPFSRTALMYVFTGDLKFADTKLYEDCFWDQNRIQLKRGTVETIDTTAREVCLREGVSVSYDVLVLATGSRPNRYGWPGQNLEGVQSLYSYQDVELLEKNAFRAKKAVIVGGGLIGIELTEMLLSRHISISYLVREKNFWGSVLPQEEAQLVNRRLLEHQVDLRLENELKEILSDAQGRVRAVITTKGDEIECQLVGLTIGVQPNTGLAKASGIECGRGILVDRFFRTSVTNVYAAGDCVQHREAPSGRRPVEQVWYSGKMQAEYLAANLCGEELPYQPGIWFNSAKFLDVEYQTYGVVLPNLPEGESSFYWEEAKGKHSLRINFTTNGGAVTGVNVFGIRHRHTVWETWLQKKVAISEVISNLAAANFDPEFFHCYEPDIRAAFQRQYHNRPLSKPTPRGLFSPYLQQLFGASHQQSTATSL